MGGFNRAPANERRGVAAGLVATMVALPALPLSLLIAAASEVTLVNRVFHLHHDYLYAMSSRDRALGAILVAVATGGLAACMSTVAAQTLVPRAGRVGYVITSALGFATILIAAWLYGRHFTKASLLQAPGLIVAWIAMVAAVLLLAASLPNTSMGDRPDVNAEQ